MTKSKPVKIAVDTNLQAELYNDDKDTTITTPCGDVLNVYVKAGTVHIKLQDSNKPFWYEQINELNHQLSTMEPK